MINRLALNCRPASRAWAHPIRLRGHPDSEPASGRGLFCDIRRDPDDFWSGARADFAGFYSAGRILTSYSPPRVYDLELQDRVYHEVLPELPIDTKLPFVYPPFFCLIFKPFAALPYTQACALWMVATPLLYLLGLAALWGTRKAIPAEEWPMTFLLAFSFQPFLECWLAGQTSVFGFAAMAWALRCEARERSFRAGLFISLCLYKPTLLVLIVPLLFVARRWRILLGFGTGAAGLAGISLLTFGWDGCLAYAHLASVFSQLINSTSFGLPRWKYIDLSNFFCLLWGRQTPACVALWAAGVLAATPCLARGWWSYGRSDPDQKALLWATVLIWTLILNVYVGACDAILATIAAFMTVDVLAHRNGRLAGAMGAGCREMLALVYLVPLITQQMAMAARFQPFTLILVAFGAYQIGLSSSLAPIRKVRSTGTCSRSPCRHPSPDESSGTGHSRFLPLPPQLVLQSRNEEAGRGDRPENQRREARKPCHGEDRQDDRGRLEIVEPREDARLDHEERPVGDGNHRDQREHG